jgi:two-component system, LytTR family, response regulator AlgR
MPAPHQIPGSAIRTLIIDDEPLAVERLQILCADLPQVHLVGSANDAAAAQRMVAALAPELLLLDIAMPGMTGIELAKQLAALPNPPMIVFVTAFDAFAVAAFDIAAVDYLLKPIDLDRLARAVCRADARRIAPVEAPSPWTEEFWVPHRGDIIRIAAADIERIEAERDYMRLHMGERSYLIHQTIVALERRLDPVRFIRIHRSTIVRRDCVARLRRDASGGWAAMLADGTLVAIGRTYLDAVRALTRSTPADA